MVRRPLTIEYALLGFLEKQSRHGYELDQIIHCTGGLGMVWRIKQSHLYAILEKLEKSGYITSSLEPQVGRPDRQIHTLTPAGQAVFNHWISSPVDHPRSIRQEFLARLFFSMQKGQEFTHNLIVAQQHVCEGWTARLINELEFITPGDEYKRILLRFRLENSRAIQDWLESTLLEISPESKPLD
jgi:PadR family transcriptional regulator, regulatory protein AphA